MRIETRGRLPTDPILRQEEASRRDVIRRTGREPRSDEELARAIEEKQIPDWMRRTRGRPPEREALRLFYDKIKREQFLVLRAMEWGYLDEGPARVRMEKLFRRYEAMRIVLGLHERKLPNDARMPRLLDIAWARRELDIAPENDGQNTSKQTLDLFKDDVVEALKKYTEAKKQ